MYLPKSKYQVLESSGEHYINPRTGDSYVGPYILTSEGAFIGSDITNLGPKLEPQQLNIPHKVYFTPSVSRYNLANDEESYYYINNTKPIVATKTKPTEKDYQKGYYTRYFASKNNESNVYYEIDKKTYKSIYDKEGKFDHHLYSAGTIRWAIDGDIINTNKKILLLKEREYPNISSLFTKLNEYQKLRYAKKGELTYEDGTPYEGYYHIHLRKPMEGAFHRSEKHKNLVFVEKNTLSMKTSTYERPKFDGPTIEDDIESGYIAPEVVQEQVTQVVPTPSTPTPSTPTPSTPTPSTPSYSGGSSGGGGGGY